jgi:hypothetical protein
MKMVAVRPFETWLNFYHTIQKHVPEGDIFHSHASRTPAPPPLQENFVT